MKRQLFILMIFLAGPAIAQETEPVHQFLDRWHQAAARADAAAFFGGIADDGVYIGTDATERWDKDSFIEFAKPYFDEGKAWDFKPFNRQIFLSEDGKYAWFSELLNTWMGTCRGSGVLFKSSDGWKIKQYHLSVTVPNEAIEEFIKLVDSFE